MSKLAGYKYLLTYQYSSVICDFTFDFCNRFLTGRELLRQRDQMTQAARSGKQNISEGSSFESLESYIKLLGVAKGSIKELLEDYEDFLRQHNLKLWQKDSRDMRELIHIPHSPELAANLMVMLCQRATYLLEKQIEVLKEKFVREGGFRENLFKLRMQKLRQCKK